MGIEYFTDETAENLPISAAVVAGDFVFVSGMCGFDANGNIITGGLEAEIRKIFADLTVLLERAGATLRDLVKVNVHLTKASDFEHFNRVYAEYFPGNKPARITVCSGMTINANIEMDFTAYINTQI